MNQKRIATIHEVRSSLPMLLAATACIGTLDMAFATVFWNVQGVSPVRILQSVASGLIGQQAFAGGAVTAALGLALHFLIALLMVLAYQVMAMRVRWLRQHPWQAGPLYGVVLYLFMTCVVVPLSAAAGSSSRPDWIVGSVLSHVLLVGLPCALFVRTALRRTVR